MRALDGKNAPKGTPIADRLMLHVIKTPGACWRWTAAVDQNGYGRIQVGGRSGRLMYAHRVSYETFAGPIPSGLEMDHLCRVRACINPLHLEPVTAQVNNRRGMAPGARALRRENCLYGHAYAEHGAMCCGRRICALCRRTYLRLYHALTREEISRRKLAGLPVVDLAAYFASEPLAVAA